MPVGIQDYSEQASVDLDEPVSWHPALRANRVTVVFPIGVEFVDDWNFSQLPNESTCQAEFRPLRRTGEVRFTGRDCLSTIVMRTTSGRAIFRARFEAARLT